MISSSEALVRVALTKDEERAILKLEAVIDSMIRDKFDGAPMVLQFNDQVAPKIAAAIQRDYERGGWKATVTAGAKLTVQLTATGVVVASAQLVVEAAPKPAGLPPMAQSTASAQPADYRILVRMPTRSRPAQALEVLQRYRDMAGCAIKLEVVVDEDDDSMLDIQVQQRLLALGCVITVGAHKSKVEACNGGRVEDWDILVLASDDMWPMKTGWALTVIEAMKQHWPHLDGALHFNDGAQGPDMCTLPVLGKRWWEQQGAVVYCPEYKSLFCDTEQTALWKQMGRLPYVDVQVIEHRHHSWGKADKDPLYVRNDALWKTDEATFTRRKQTVVGDSQWAFVQPQLLLSVCICTIPGREEKLRQLLDHMWTQILWLDDPREVEILVDGTSGIKIGEKRQRLLDRAKGHFVCSVDDDDFVSHDYFGRILAEIKKDLTVDCLAMRGVMTTAGAVSETFEHSIKYGWDQGGGEYKRAINHLNPVRRDLALQVGFKPNLHFNEDQDYGDRLRSLLKREGDLGDTPIYYYFFVPKNSQ